MLLSVRHNGVKKQQEKCDMLYFSSLLKVNSQYSLSAENLFCVLSDSGENFTLFDGAKDIWVRDYMPVRTKSGQYVSFRYEPNYLADDPQLRTNFKADIAPHFTLPVTYSNINLDGGNVVFSPSKTKAVITDRVFSENPEYDKNTLLLELENLLEAEIIIIPSLEGDIPSHAGNMVRFLDNQTVLCNEASGLDGFNRQLKTTLQYRGFDILEFPFAPTDGRSGVGRYLNYLETDEAVFLPVFCIDADARAVVAAEKLFSKPVEPVMIPNIAADVGGLHSISWDMSY